MFKTKKLSTTKKVLTWAIHGKPQEVTFFPMEKTYTGETLSIDQKEINLTLDKLNELIKGLKTNISLLNTGTRKTRAESFQSIIRKFENIVATLNTLESFYDQNLNFKKITLSAENYHLCRLYLSDAYWQYGQNSVGSFDIAPKFKDSKDLPFNILLILLHAHYLVAVKNIALRLLNNISAKEQQQLTDLVFSQKADQYNLAPQLSQQTDHINENAQNLVLNITNIKKSLKYLAHKFRFNLLTLQTLDQRLTEKLQRYFTINTTFNDRDQKNRSPFGYLITSLSLSAILLFNSICSKSSSELAEQTAKPDSAKATLVIDKSEEVERKEEPKPVEPKQDIKYEWVTETRTRKVPYQEKIQETIYKKKYSGVNELTGKEVYRDVADGTKEKTITKYRDEKYEIKVRKKIKK